MQNILEVRNLGRSYVNFRLEHISFSIAGGTIMGLVGENGAGKSTTTVSYTHLSYRSMSGRTSGKMR